MPSWLISSRQRHGIELEGAGESGRIHDPAAPQAAGEGGGGELRLEIRRVERLRGEIGAQHGRREFVGHRRRAVGAGFTVPSNSRDEMPYCFLAVSRVMSNCAGERDRLRALARGDVDLQFHGRRRAGGEVTQLEIQVIGHHVLVAHAAVFDLDSAEVRQIPPPELELDVESGAVSWLPKSCQLPRPAAFFNRRRSSPSISMRPISNSLRSNGRTFTRSATCCTAAKGCGTEARRIAQARGTELERDPREYRELDLAGQGELAAGGVLHRARDTVFVVVWIDEQPYTQQHHDEQGESPPTTIPTSFKARILATPSRTGQPY